MADMIQYVIFNIKEEAENFCKAVDNLLGYPKVVFGNTMEGLNQTENYKTTYSTYATPIKKYNADNYAYPVTEDIQHLVPAEKELKYDLDNWYCDAII